MLVNTFYKLHNLIDWSFAYVVCLSSLAVIVEHTLKDEIVIEWLCIYWKQVIANWITFKN